MQNDQAASALVVGPSGPEATETAEGMEIDPHAGAVAAYSESFMLRPTHDQARTTCQKGRALLGGLAACALMLSAGISMARRHSQGSPEQNGASTRSQSVWTAPTLLETATRLGVWHTPEIRSHTELCNRLRGCGEGRASAFL